MTFQPVSIESLPKRQSRIKPVDIEAANALLALVSVPGQAASDGATYASQADARKEAGKARRMLVRVAPDPELVKSRVYGEGEDWHWAVSLATEKPAKKGKKA